jgi:serine/threonine protein kinase
VDPADLDIREKLGEGEFGTVHLAYWHGTMVAVKILRKSDEVAMGDFKTELNILMKVSIQSTATLHMDSRDERLKDTCFRKENNETSRPSSTSS